MDIPIAYMSAYFQEIERKQRYGNKKPIGINTNRLAILLVILMC